MKTIIEDRNYSLCAIKNLNGDPGANNAIRHHRNRVVKLDEQAAKLKRELRELMMAARRGKDLGMPIEALEKRIAEIKEMLYGKAP